MTPEYSETYFLSAGETNPEQELSLPLLTAKIIDIATAHANSLGIGNPAMADIHAGWVLSRLTIEMTAYPRVNDTYTLTTWIESWNRRFSERAFMITCGDRIMGYARSIWMVMDIESRHNVGLTHLNLSPDMISTRPCPIARQMRHCPIIPISTSQTPVTTCPANTPSLPTTTPALPTNTPSLPAGAIEATAPATPYTFKYCDLDSYRHVNTVRYVTMLLNQFTLADFDATFVDRLELSFLHETRYGMSVRLLRADTTTTPTADTTAAPTDSHTTDTTAAPTDTPPTNTTIFLSSFSLVRADTAEALLFARLRRRPRS